MRKYLPSDFPRKPKTLKFLKIWKATEFRNFLMYYGPVILKDILSKKLYEHLLTLHFAIRLLADPEGVKLEDNISCAAQLLDDIVSKFEKYYEAKYVSFNVHNLNHLAADVKEFGTWINSVRSNLKILFVL